MTEPADLPPELAGLAFLVGAWRGEGVGGYPTIETFGYGQEVAFSWYGKPVLAYSSRTWALDDQRPLAVETGFWRPQPDGALEVTLAHPTGLCEVYLGQIAGTTIEMWTGTVARTATAKEVSRLHRLYGLVGEELMYAVDMEAVGQPMHPHLSARLQRMEA